MGVTTGGFSIDVDVILGNCKYLYVFNERPTPAY